MEGSGKRKLDNEELDNSVERKKLKPSPIKQFRGKYYFLSNYWSCPVKFEGIVYRSSEHAYQAAKFTDPEIRKKIQECKSPGEAKRMGRKGKLRPDWEDIKLSVMEDIVRQKFTSNSDLLERLLDTGDAHLEEGNTWGDTFWGVCGQKGTNHLGKILMKIRNELGGPEE